MVQILLYTKMHMKKFFIFSLLITGCGGLELSNHPSLSDQQPYVLETSPPNKSAITKNSNIRLIFSRPVDRDSITSETVLLLNTDPTLFSLTEIQKKIFRKEWISIEVEYFLENETDLELKPRNPLEGGTVWILVLPEVRTPDGFPFNQIPGENPTPFISGFAVENTEENANTQTPAGEPQNTGISRPSYLYLSEILYDSSISDTDGYLFIELYGEPNTLIGKYEIAFINGSDGAVTESLTLPETAMIPESGFFVIADSNTNSKTETRVSTYHWVDNFDPQNGPDAVQLLSPEKTLVDVVGYGSPLMAQAKSGIATYWGEPAGDAPADFSLHRKDLNTFRQNNHEDWVVNSAPSPGQATVIPME